MADKRMLTKKVTDSDEFISLPSSAQALYMHLNLGADDDGFNNQVQVAMFKAHASAGDLMQLLQRRYVLQFNSGVFVIKHWRMANALRKDRYTPTAFQEELKQLKIKDNGAYTITNEEVWLPDGCQMVATDKYSIDKISISNISSSNETSFEAPSEDKSSSLEELFASFWTNYPRKQDKKNAHKSFLKLKPDEALLKQMLNSLEKFKQTEQWKEANGKYIPLPSTWLNGRRWEDSIGVEREKTAYEKLMEEMGK